MPNIVDFLQAITTNARAWNDINFEGVQLGVGASAPDLVSILDSGSINARAFDGNAILEQLYAGGEMLHDYKEGTDIYFHVHWMPTSTNTGNVKWNVEYSWQNMEDSHNLMPAPSTVSAIDNSTGVKWYAKTKAFNGIDGTGKKIGSHIMFRLYRDPADANDTYPDDAALMSVGIHYKVDSWGSRQTFVK